MNNVKQVIVLRRDLGMRKGKCAAQAAHAAMKVFFDQATVAEGTMTIPLTPMMHAWVTGIFIKIVVGCVGEAELLALRDRAVTAGFPYALIQDCGRTEFHNVPTYTALAIGPAEAAALDLITGHLTLL